MIAGTFIDVDTSKGEQLILLPNWVVPDMTGMEAPGAWDQPSPMQVWARAYPLWRQWAPELFR